MNITNLLLPKITRKIKNTLKSTIKIPCFSFSLHVYTLNFPPFSYFVYFFPIKTEIIENTYGIL